MCCGRYVSVVGCVVRIWRSVKQRIRAGLLARQPSAWCLRQVQLRRMDSPVLVYAPSKTGTTSIGGALRTGDLGRPALKFHHLSAPALEWTRRMRGEQSAYFRGSDRHMWDADYVRAAIETTPDRQWEVVTAVREPLSRSVSAFFEGAERRGDVDLSVPYREQSIDRLTRLFVANHKIHAVSSHWFASEFKLGTGVDVFSTEFPAEQGFAIYESPRFRVLLIRFEDLPSVGPTAIADFFGWDTPASLPALNSAEGKSYAHLRERFRREALIPPWLVDSLQSSPVANHFYSPSELARERLQYLR